MGRSSSWLLIAMIERVANIRLEKMTFVCHFSRLAQGGKSNTQLPREAIPLGWALSRSKLMCLRHIGWTSAPADGKLATSPPLVEKYHRNLCTVGAEVKMMLHRSTIYSSPSETHSSCQNGTRLNKKNNFVSRGDEVLYKPIFELKKKRGAESHIWRERIFLV